MNSYLMDRQQCVRINDITSDIRITKMGVPQGTILGPFLFLIYVDDLLQESCISYADDTVVLYSADTWAEAERGMNDLLERIAKFLQ